MSATTVAFIGALVYRYRNLLPILDEHLADNDELVLPHLIMADVMRFLVAEQGNEPRLVQSIIQWLDAAYGDGDDDVRDVIAVSGVAMIPDPGQPGSELRVMLGSHLTTVDPWRP